MWDFPAHSSAIVTMPLRSSCAVATESAELDVSNVALGEHDGGDSTVIVKEVQAHLKSLKNSPEKV